MEASIYDTLDKTYNWLSGSHDLLIKLSYCMDFQPRESMESMLKSSRGFEQ